MTEESNVEMQTDSTENNESNVSADSHVGQVQWFNKKKGMLIALGIISMFVILLILYLIFK